ncbi:MAG: apolipoprotein N-acyltransferase, partial [Alphaproteobacteria bacterium]|nr:apolipoprotein N-acyltransferase [Alphaproteobacteria bacterium]
MRTRLAGLAGRKRFLAAAVAGIGATLAMPPLGATPALAAGLVALVWLLDGATGFRSAFLTAFAFAFGFFAAGLYWVAGSFFVVGGATAAAGPLAVLGLAGLLSCFLALPAALAHRLTPPGAGRALALAVALGLGDWLRGHLFTGFPWNLFGYAWLHVPAVEQAAAAIGIYGVGLATLAIALLLSVADWRAWTAAALAAVAMFGWGEARLGRAPPPEVSGGTLLRLVQP